MKEVISFEIKEKVYSPIGVHISMRKPSRSLMYATVCPHGLTLGSTTSVAPELTADSIVAATSFVVNPSSIPNVFCARLLSI
jgi:hypothetical protein